MVFKRRDKRTYLTILLESIYPKGGWTRAVLYIQHRVNRLPDSPERIARGIFAGVITAFTPLYGVHFVIAFVIAKIMRGNVFAALAATFFGNPLTYFPIALISISMGNWLLGRPAFDDNRQGVAQSFGNAARDLWDNFKALFTHRDADWERLFEFYDQVFFPFMIGSLIPGAIAAVVAYYLSVPVIRAYQKRRTKKLREKIEARRKKARTEAGAAKISD